jgi:hypothetical protein
VLLAEKHKDRHVSIRLVLRFFEYDHLSDYGQRVSKIFYNAADQMLETVRHDDPELTVGLRKLLEAKDAAVRAGLSEVFRD